MQLSPETYALLADALVVFHLAIVVYAVLGQLLIAVGCCLRWSWVRNPWFRVSHLAIVLFVAVQALYGALCPLTIWEDQLRRQAGQTVQDGSFIGRLAHDLLFVDVPIDTLNAVYVAFGAVVVATAVGCPPRLRRRAAPSTSPAP